MSDKPDESTEDEATAPRALPARPECFGKVNERDMKAARCISCRWSSTCGVAVRGAAYYAGHKATPGCFGDPKEHDLGDAGCRNCMWQQTCGVIVRNKLSIGGRIATMDSLIRKGMERVVGWHWRTDCPAPPSGDEQDRLLLGYADCAYFLLVVRRTGLSRDKIIYMGPENDLSEGYCVVRDVWQPDWKWCELPPEPNSENTAEGA